MKSVASAALWKLISIRQSEIDRARKRERDRKLVSSVTNRNCNRNGKDFAAVRKLNEFP